jgi:hypothetical protein
MTGGRSVYGARDIEPDGAETRSRHSSQRRGDGVAASVEILDSLENQVGSGHVQEVRVGVDAHGLIVLLGPYGAVNWRATPWRLGRL